MSIGFGKSYQYAGINRVGAFNKTVTDGRGEGVRMGTTSRMKSGGGIRGFMRAKRSRQSIASAG